MGIGAGNRSGKVAALVLAPTAAAVAVVMLVLRMRIEPPTVPPYRVTAVRVMPDVLEPPEASAELALHPGERLKLTLEPEGQLTGAIGGRVFLVRGEQVRPVEPQPEFFVDRDGTMHVEADASALFAGVAAGEWDVAIAVGRPETLPRAPADVLHAPAPGAQGAPWFLVRQHVRFGG